MCEPSWPHGINNKVNRVDWSAVWHTLEEFIGTQKLVSAGG